MKKILFIAADGFSKTGVPAVFMNIVRELKKYNFSFDIIYFDKSKNFYLKEFEEQGKAFYFGIKSNNYFIKKISRYVCGGYYYRKTLKVIKNNGPYLAIHSFLEYRGSYFLKAASKAGLPLRIYHSNNILNITGNIINKLLMKKEKKMCLKYMTKLIGCSEQSIYSAFQNSFPSCVINNAYNEKEYYPSLSQNKINKIALAQTGTFCDRKNQLFSLLILSEIKKRGFDCSLNFVGYNKGEYFEKVKKMVEDLNLKDFVCFNKFDSNQREIFSKCRYFLMPSKREAFGISAIEAQACGLKVFASNNLPASIECGGCKFLDLDIGAKKWAESIINDFVCCDKSPIIFDCSKYKNENIIPLYLSLYEKKV